MRLEVQLVHAEAGVRVVLVTGWVGSECLGSALGEAADAEEAERRAEQRLQQRLGASAPLLPRPAAPERSQPPAPAAAIAPASPRRLDPPATVIDRDRVQRQPAGGQAVHQGALTPQAPPQLPALEAPEAAMAAPSPPRPLPLEPAAPAGPEPSDEPAPDPEDWSDDLARIDLQLLRLGWDRAQEAQYLERAFGHPSRSRLTRYGDLLAYLQALSALAVGADPAQVPLPMRRLDLIEQCDDLLGRLGWDPDQGRLFLELHFQCASRQHLSDQQLLQFNMLLEEQWLQQASAPTA